MSICRKQVLIVAGLAALCFLVPRPARAGAPQWPQKVHGSRSIESARETAQAKPHRDRHDQLGRGFDGSDLFCSFAAFRYRSGSDDSRALASRDSAVRRLSRHQTDQPAATQSGVVRTVDSLPPHRIATHLSI